MTDKDTSAPEFKVACPTCHMAPNRYCRTGTGLRAKHTHTSRIELAREQEEKK